MTSWISRLTQASWSTSELMVVGTILGAVDFPNLINIKFGRSTPGRVPVAPKHAIPAGEGCRELNRAAPEYMEGCQYGGGSNLFCWSSIIIIFWGILLSLWFLSATDIDGTCSPLCYGFRVHCCQPQLCKWKSIFRHLQWVCNAFRAFFNLAGSPARQSALTPDGIWPKL